MTGVRFLFRVTLRRHDLAAGVIRGRPRLPPLPQQVEAGGSFCGSLMCQTSVDTSFLDAVLAGVFTVPGDGCVDFAGVLEELAAAGTTAGW